jgi:hypothetical protein
VLAAALGSAVACATSSRRCRRRVSKPVSALWRTCRGI